MTARISEERLRELATFYSHEFPESASCGGHVDADTHALLNELLAHRQALERAREAIEFAATELGNSLRYNDSTNKQAATLRSLLSTTESKGEKT